MSWMAAAVGGSALLGYMGTKSTNKANAEAAEGAGMPMWDPRQEPYLFGSTGWQPEMPQLNAEAMNYATALSGGYNPQYGPQGPMGFEQLLSGILGMGGGQPPMKPYPGGGGGAINMGPMLPQPHPGGGMNTGPMLPQQGAPQGAPQGAQDTPWFMDPSASTQGYGAQQGGIQGLLGYGQGVPPPLMTNNPYFSGQGVRNPENLMQGPGRYDPALAAQEQQAPPNGLLQRANDSPAMPAPSSSQLPAYMQPDAYGKPAWARDMVL